MNPPRQPSFRPTGFTLAEVAMALGIMSFALVALMGMLPVGLKTFRDSVSLTTESQIAQQLFTRIQQAPFASVPQLGGSYYFNEEGFEVPPGDFIFHARVTVGTGGQPVPAGADSRANTWLKPVRIEIARNVQVDQAAAAGTLRTFAYVIADTGL